jgi:hypothetical protein
MTKLLTTLVFMISLNAFATQTIVPTEGSPLHLSCVFNFTPFFIELESSQTKGKLSLNNRVDSEGRGRSREFVSNLNIAFKTETSSHKLITFNSTTRNAEFNSVYVTIPKFMNLYLGMADQPARIDLYGESHLPGSCFVQFPPFAPQW